MAAPIGSHLAWYADADFVAARNHVIPPNGQTAYDVVPPSSYLGPHDRTDFIYGQRTWSPRHMPNILYRLRANQHWDQFRRTPLPAQKIDPQGNPMFERWPSNAARARALLDFEVLPDRIGSNEHWWRFEAWRRLDPRIRWVDIAMRIENTNRPSNDLLRSKVSRPRIEFSILSWFNAPGGQGVNNLILANLTAAQIQANTSRGSTPGLIDPTQGTAGGRIYLPGEDASNDTEPSSSSSSEEDDDQGDGGDDDEDDDGEAAEATNEDEEQESQDASEEEAEEADEDQDEFQGAGPAPKRPRTVTAGAAEQRSEEEETNPHAPAAASQGTDEGLPSLVTPSFTTGRPPGTESEAPGPRCPSHSPTDDVRWQIEQAAQYRSERAELENGAEEEEP